MSSSIILASLHISSVSSGELSKHHNWHLVRLRTVQDKPKNLQIFSERALNPTVLTRIPDLRTIVISCMQTSSYGSFHRQVPPYDPAIKLKHHHWSHQVRDGGSDTFTLYPLYELWRNSIVIFSGAASLHGTWLSFQNFAWPLFLLDVLESG